MLRSTPAVPLDFFFQRGRGTGAGSASDLQIRVLLRFGGLLDLGLLERALHAIVDAEPMLRARLVETSPLVGRWEVRDDEGAVPPCELDEVTEADAESAVASFLSGTAVRDEGPYVRLRVVRAGRRDALCLRIDHRLCDGGAAKILTARLCDAYRRLSAGAHLQPPRRELLPRSVSGLTGRALPPPPPPPPPGDLYSYAVPRRGFANERPAYAIRVLEAAAVRGALTLSIGYCRSDLDPAVPEGILDRMVAELGAFAAGG